MSRGAAKAFSTEWLKLVEQVANGKPAPKVMPTTIALGKIRRNPAVFQHRDHGTSASQKHIRTLLGALRRGRTLSPIKVWWDGKGWACVDGHHRLEAYKAAGFPEQVPVSVFVGSIEKAISEAARGNTEDKLPMSQAEKSNAAWRLTVATAMSKAEVSKAASISEATVAAMRRVHAQLKAREDALPDPLDAVNRIDYRDLTWEQARRFADSRDETEFDWETELQKKAAEMALLIRKAIGNTGGANPEVFAEAIKLYDTRLWGALLELMGAPPEEDEYDEDGTAREDF